MFSLKIRKKNKFPAFLVEIFLAVRIFANKHFLLLGLMYLTFRSGKEGADHTKKDHTPVFTIVEDPRSNPHTPSGFVWLKLEDKSLSQWEKPCLRRHYGREGCSFLSSTKINELVKSTVISSAEVQSQVQCVASATYGNTRIKSISTVIQQQGPALKIESYGYRKGGCCAGTSKVDIFEADFLVAIHCDFWPEKAEGKIVRKKR